MENTDIHWVSLAKSTAISQYCFPDFITPLEVIAVLQEAKVSFMLVGHHGLCGWMKKPRATEDVDVLVAARQHKKAVRELSRAFPQLEAVNHPTVTRLRDRPTERGAIDVLLPNRPPYRDALKHTRIPSRFEDVNTAFQRSKWQSP